VQDRVLKYVPKRATTFQRQCFSRHSQAVLPANMAICSRGIHTEANKGPHVALILQSRKSNWQCWRNLLDVSH
jgi:hypothetical protein